MKKIDTDSLQAANNANGVVTSLNDNNAAVFFKGSSTLLVTFDNLDDARNQVSENRLPFGSNFAVSRGWSSLGMMTNGWTWYRDSVVADYFDHLKAQDFFSQFARVVFYGTSMGGYAAAAFSSAAPGATVLLMNPQATLAREITASWETRYVKAWRYDFSGRYGYAPDQVKLAEKVHLFYDPYGQVQDGMHAALFHGDNIEKYRCRFFGHGITTSLLKMGILSKVVEGCVNGTASPTDIYSLLRARRETEKYQKSLLYHLSCLNRPWLTRTYCDAVLRRSKSNRPRFARAGDEATRALRAQRP